MRWISFAFWVLAHRARHRTFRHFEGERAVALGQTAPTMPRWKQRLAPWAHIRDSLLRSPVQGWQFPKGVYLRIPKAASTAVFSVALPQIDTGLPAGMTEEEIEAYAYRLRTSRLAEVPAALPRFALVRHPIDRFLSVYKSYFQRPDIPFPFADYLWGALNPEATLEEVVAAIERIPDRFRDPHFMSQTRLLGGAEAVRQTNLYRVENLKPEVAIPELGEVLPIRNAQGPQPEISEELRDRIAQLYAEDIALLGY